MRKRKGLLEKDLRHEVKAAPTYQCYENSFLSRVKRVKEESKGRVVVEVEDSLVYRAYLSRGWVKISSEFHLSDEEKYLGGSRRESLI